MEEAVEQSDGEDGIGEDLVPLAEALVGGEDDRLLGLVALVDDLEEEGRVRLLEGQIANFIELCAAPHNSTGSAFGADPTGEIEMVDLLRSDLDDGSLRVDRLGRGISWLDAGTPSALHQAAQFVEVMQERQGLQVASPEQVAFRMGYIERDQLAVLAHRSGETRYGRYLMDVAQDKA